MKRKRLEWYAIREDFNSHRLENYNVLGGLEKEIKKRVAKDNIKDYETFKANVRSLLMYYYWCRAEHEVLVSGLFCRDNEDEVYKIDVWYQLEPNLDRIVEYIIRTLDLDIT